MTLFYEGKRNLIRNYVTERKEIKMDWNDDQIIDREKTKLSTKFGCFFGIVILVLLIILVPVWFYFSYPDETQLRVSNSPNNVNIIQIVKR